MRVALAFTKLSVTIQSATFDPGVGKEDEKPKCGPYCPAWVQEDRVTGRQQARLL